MRTTILIGSLLFLAGYAPAQQDSPITVGDTAPIIPGAGAKQRPTKKAAPGNSTYVGHSSFQHDPTDSGKKSYFVLESGYKAACFEMTPKGVVPPPNPVSLLGQSWELKLNTGIKLNSTGDPSKIEIRYPKDAIDDVQYHEIDDPLIWGDLKIDGGKAVRYTPSKSPKQFVIHYCPDGKCPSPNPCP